MPVEISWLLEERVILCKLSGILTEDGVEPFNRAMLAIYDQAKVPKIHTIADMSQLERTPGIQTIKQLNFTKHPVHGWNMFYGVKSPTLMFFGKVMFQLTPGSNRMVNTKDEAIEYLMIADPTLPDLKKIAVEQIESVALIP